MRITTRLLAAVSTVLVAAPFCLAQGSCFCTDGCDGGCDTCVSGACAAPACDACGCCDHTARLRARDGRFRMPTLSQVCDSMSASCKCGTKACRGLFSGGRVPTNPDCRAQAYAWHRGYAHSEFGQPVALVVPPTSHLQTNWSWGTGSSRISRIDHQFNRHPPAGGGFGGGRFRYTPAWPSDTTQFGVYPVRGLW